MKKLLMVLAIMALAASANAQLVITGLYDGPLPGGLPKGVELYACSDIADLSAYGIGSANNGGGTDGEEFTFPADAIAGGTFIYVATEEVFFTQWFGFAPNYTDYAMSINGDDAIELFHEGEVVDIHGDINLDGTGTAWDSVDGWAKRITLTGPDGSTFVLENWDFSGINVWDGEELLTNATSATPFPLGDYECDPAVADDATSFGTIKALFR